MFLLLYTITAPSHETVHTKGGKNGVLQMRAQAPWFSNHPEPVQSINYKSESLAKNKTETNHSYETAEDTLWDNLLDVSYWSEGSDSAEFWQDIVNAENEEDKTTQFTTEAVNATNAESLCPERRSVVFTEDGQRNIPQELYNMATQVCKNNEIKHCKSLRRRRVYLPFFFFNINMAFRS